jgi:hypothetical protein
MVRMTEEDLDALRAAAATLERRYGKSAVRAAYERFCYETEAAA